MAANSPLDGQQFGPSVTPGYFSTKLKRKMISLSI
jgi:hypothetical protein